ncbi:hypothetical protein IV102_06910 [bacterium]|nr:hypothetical protein [bacterium]
MKLQNANCIQPQVRTLGRLSNGNSGDDKSPDPPKEEFVISKTYDHLVTGSAFAAGGASVGYFMGAGAGNVLSNIGATAAYVNYGPMVGASLGATWGALAYSGGDDKVSNLIRAGVTTYTGSTLGLVACDGVGHLLGNLTNVVSFSQYGGLAGFITGGAVGLAISRIDKQDTASKVAKGLASAALGGTAGWFLGGGTAAFITSLTHPGLLPLAPALGLSAGALIGLASYVQKQL